MDWLREIDGYCERLGPEYWAEPINAVTNAAFVVAALIMWQRTKGIAIARVLAMILGLIGVGSYLFHTHAQVWAAIADVTPILGYILVYIYAVNRHVWGLRMLPALGLTGLFFPYAAATLPLFQMVPGLGDSAGYAPVPLLIYIYAVLLRHRAAETARGLAIGATILVASITFRALDEPICGAVPMGTHFMWHILNGIMLGWMIEVLRRHMLGLAKVPQTPQ
ncbi:ceramidase domain-containing protein [Tropicibacter sp. R16_0]|uniref:ceramidase domain-containing protein n=1 Tax=Tropicibacter sp. R16_0 TaxID=2821102 RepID=UPI001ADC3433|nr:ceramidase domain-containing protein [Tropicibacter sp. R16_0]MBO9449250.1 ceramidase domain-containing protein [Tropicibacter sp. R16_0]